MRSSAVAFCVMAVYHQLVLTICLVIEIILQSTRGLPHLPRNYGFIFLIVLSYRFSYFSSLINCLVLAKTILNRSDYS